MRILLLILFSLTSLALRAEDPLFLIAAKERERNAKAFEVKWSYAESIQGMEVFVPKRERIEAETIGRGELMVDGENWWYKTDPDSSRLNLPSHRREEGSFNGSETFYSWGSQIKIGPRVGDWNYTQIKYTDMAHVYWPVVAAPLRILFRDTQPVPVLSPRTGHTSWVQVGGSLQTIGGRMCQEYQRRFWDRPSPERLWVDPSAGHLPIRYQDPRSGTLTVEYQPHPVLGWVPSRWTITVGRPPLLDIRHTKVKIDSFELRDTIPADRFTLKFPVGSRVSQIQEHASGNVTESNMVVAEDGTLTPIQAEEQPGRSPTEVSSLARTLWVVGGTLAVFITIVSLVKWLARRPPGEQTKSHADR